VSRVALFAVRANGLYWTRGRFVSRKEFAGHMIEAHAIKVAQRLGGVVIPV
jgi:hypothetical protein